MCSSHVKCTRKAECADVLLICGIRTVCAEERIRGRTGRAATTWRPCLHDIALERNVIKHRYSLHSRGATCKPQNVSLQPHGRPGFEDPRQEDVSVWLSCRIVRKRVRQPVDCICSRLIPDAGGNERYRSFCILAEATSARGACGVAPGEVLGRARLIGSTDSREEC
jgi:hypothetical protein